MIPTMTLIKEDDILKVNGSIYLSEKIQNPQKNAEMKLELSVKPEKIIYKLFCIQKKQSPESSRLDFFHLKEFPDGIFLEKKDDGTYHCYIFELKFTGSNDLKKLTRQLFSGYIHCKTLLSVLDIDYRSTEISFHVVCVQENSKQSEFNRIKPAKKFIVGKPLNNNSDFDEWLSNRLIYRAGEYKKVLNIEKIFLKTTDDYTYYNKLEI
ncbi:hypothetical protein MOE19_17165 [Bacillus atrophaeus]|uniref:hypothetical protein n=1 Tax=Bacillus atrophaeus TaxID=1452 RepID=UPI00228120FB|nr:hypothetical protein [Bacillus atrophaeus]MCY8818440.1 hypothetical protein [Bacillus atrophaeus]